MFQDYAPLGLFIFFISIKSSLADLDESLLAFFIWLHQTIRIMSQFAWRELMFDWYHLHTTQESYVQHMKMALGYSLRLLWASIACCIHAFCPIVFTRTASSICLEIVGDVNRRQVDKNN